MAVLLSTTSSLRNCESSVDPRLLLFGQVNEEIFTSTTSSVSFYSSSEESSPGKNPPRILAENFDDHRGILGGKFSFTDSVGQGVPTRECPGWVSTRSLRFGFKKTNVSGQVGHQLGDLCGPDRHFSRTYPNPPPMFLKVSDPTRSQGFLVN